MTDYTRDLIERLIEECPIETSTEGLDDCCHFCGADARYKHMKRIGEPAGHWAEHEWDCPWVEATRFLGRDLGLNQVKARPE